MLALVATWPLRAWSAALVADDRKPEISRNGVLAATPSVSRTRASSNSRSGSIGRIARPPVAQPLIEFGKAGWFEPFTAFEHRVAAVTGMDAPQRQPLFGQGGAGRRGKRCGPWMWRMGRRRECGRDHQADSAQRAAGDQLATTEQAIGRGYKPDGRAFPSCAHDVGVADAEIQFGFQPLV